MHLDHKCHVCLIHHIGRDHYLHYIKDDPCLDHIIYCDCGTVGCVNYRAAANLPDPKPEEGNYII